MSGSYTVTEQMDFGDDDDILEIAAYGTQAVCIKREEEESPAIIIKEESTIAIECENNECSDRRHHSLTDLPMVYTTRLDQMNAFNKIGRHTAAEATEMILVESKPCYKQIPLQIGPEPPGDAYFGSYTKLCSQVQQLNTIVKNETYLRNEKLIKMCKPLKIELEDFRKRQIKPPANKVIEYREFEDSSDEYVPPSYSSDEYEPLSKLTSNPRVSITGYSPASITVAIRDKRSQEADIYIIDANIGVKSYYRTTMAECEKLKILHLSKKILVLEYCCWVNREKLIQQLVQIFFAKAGVLHFLRKPHNCLPTPCSCCCAFETPMLKQPSNDEFTKQLNKIYDTELIIPVRNNSNKIIEKANNYMPKEHDVIIPVIRDEPTDFLKHAVIIMKYQRIIFAQTNILGENYEIGNKGEIINYVRPSVNRSITEEKQLHKKHETNEKRIYFSYLICCWHHREDVMTQLRDSSKLSPGALRFMRTPHLCRSYKCECCCKPVPLIHYTLKNITIHNNPSLYKKQSKIKLPVNKEEMKKRITKSDNHILKAPIRGNLGENIKIQNENTIKNTESRTTTNPKASQKVNICSAMPETPKQQNTVQENIEMTIDSCFEQNLTPNNNKTATKNTQFQPTISNNINLGSENTAGPPSTVVTNVLDRFKDLKLSVNENGKLTAIISTLPGKLSTVEIKVLTDILLLAATQIEQLGMTAHEFCNQVNVARAVKNPIISPMPRLVPIHSNIINKTVINDSRATKNSASNLPMMQLQYVTKSMPNLQGCKTHSLNSSLPITRNKAPVCSIYQMMSNIGGQKNQHLVKAYKLHFKEKDDEDVLLDKKRVSHPELANLPKIGEIYSLKNNEIKKVNPSARAPAAKRKKSQAAKPPPKKFRISPFENLPKQIQRPDQNSRNQQNFRISELNSELSYFVNNIDIVDNDVNVQKPVTETEQNRIPRFASSRNVIPVANKSVKIVPQPANHIPLFVTNSRMAAIENTSVTFNAPIFADNSEVIPGQNTCDTDPLQPAIEAPNVNNSNFLPVPNLSVPQFKLEANNQIPMFVPNTNFIPMHTEHSMETDNQTPLFVTNSNFIRGIDFPQSKTRADNNQIPILIPSSNFVLMQNTGVTNVPQTEMRADQNQTQIPDAKNHVIQVPHPVQNPTATNLLQPCWIPHFVTNNNVLQIPNTSSMNVLQVGTDNQTPPFVTNSNVTPIQNNSNCSQRNARTPSENPLLYQMLSQASPTPPRLAPLSHRPRPRGRPITTSPLPPTKVSVQPIIEAHRKYRNKNKSKITSYYKSPVPKNTVKDINPSVSNETDVESLLTTTYIGAAKPVVLSQEEILDAVNNKQLIDVDEEDGIFGV